MTAAGISRRIAVVDDHYSEGAIVVHLPNKIHNIFHVQIFSQKDTKLFRIGRNLTVVLTVSGIDILSKFEEVKNGMLARFFRLRKTKSRKSSSKSLILT